MSEKLGSVCAISAVFAAALTSACVAGVDPGSADEAALGDTSEAVIRAPVTREAPWSVKIQGDTFCTAEVLTRHWLLTAAHCLFGKPEFAFNRSVSAVNPTTGIENQVFSGGARYILHPGYVHESSDRIHDLALIQLDGSGVDLPSYARLYTDAREPWQSNFTGSRQFEVAGFGFGSDPGGASQCEDGVIGIKRLGTAFALNGRFLSSGGAAMKVTGQYTADQQLCDGDSGSPWMLRRGHTLMQFAIHSGNRGAIGGGDKAATLVRPKLGFILQETANRGRPIECFPDTKDGYSFLSCQDKRVKVFGEVENATLVAPMVLGTSGNASFSRYVGVPANTSAAGGSARLTVSLPQTDQYVVWIRAYVPTSTPNAFSVSIDNSLPREVPMDPSASGTFQWVGLRLAGQLTAFNLSAGNHSVSFGRGLAGAQIDQVLLTSDPNYVPFESFVEAESGQLVSPMTFVRGVATAFSSTYGSGFIRVPDGSGPGGLAIYTFNVPVRADYLVWAHSSSTAPDHNSFKVMFDADSDNDDWSWQTPGSGSGWEWSGIFDSTKGLMHVMLEAGSHWMAIKQDETGTALDRMIITNNLGFIPLDPPVLVPPVLTVSTSGTASTFSAVAVGGFTKLP